MGRRRTKPTLPEKDETQGGWKTTAAARSGGNGSPMLTSRWTTPLAAAIIILAAIAAYENSFGNPFLFDDDPTILKNPTIRRLWPIWDVFCPPKNGETVTGRPLLNFTMAVNYAISGEEPWSYHAVNLVIHILAALALFAILRRTFLLPAMRDRWGAHAMPLAFVIALLWAVHPMQTESVTYVVQRAESLVGLLYLLTLYCFLRGTSSPRPAAWWAATVAVCTLGMASKEVMVSAPLIVLLYDRAFVAGSFREVLRGRWALYAAMACTWILLAWLVLTTGNRGGSAGFGVAISPWAYLGTQFGAILRYLRLSIWPHPLVFDYGTPIVRGFWEIAPCGALVCLLGLATVVALWRWPKVGFLGAWFFAILAPTSSIVPVVTQTIAEHRMYLPLAAVWTGVVLCCYLVGRRMVQKRQISLQTAQTTSVAAVALAAILFVCMTHERNLVYRSPFAMWDDTLAKMPNSARAHNNFGIQLVHAGRVSEGMAEYRKAIDLKPEFIDSHYNLGLELADLGRVDEAMSEYEAALRIKPDHEGALNSLAVLLVDRGRVDEAIELYKKVMELKPDLAEVRYNYANALVAQKKYKEAIPLYQQAVELKPDFADAHCDLALLLATCSDAAIRDGAKAVACAQRAVGLSEGKDPSILETLAAAYAEAGRFPEAVQTARLALQFAVARRKLDLADTIRDRLKLYEAGVPYHESESEKK